AVDEAAIVENIGDREHDGVARRYAAAGDRRIDRDRARRAGQRAVIDVGGGRGRHHAVVGGRGRRGRNRAEIETVVVDLLHRGAGGDDAGRRRVGGRHADRHVRGEVGE